MQHPTPISLFFQEPINVEKITPILHIRQRPAMYLGATDARGIAQLLDDVLVLLLPAADGKSCALEIEIHPSGRFVLQFESDADWVVAMQQLDSCNHFAYKYILQVLRAISTQLEVHYHGRAYLFSPFAELQPWRPIGDAGTGFLRLEFSLDATIFSSLELDVDSFLERIHLLAMLHRQAKFTVEDRLHDLPRVHLIQEADGLIALYRQTKSRAAAQPICELHFRGRVRGHDMDISIGLVGLSSKAGHIRTFANTQETTDGGSLKDGLLAGLARALQLKQRKQISRLRKCVIASAVVWGNDFQFLHPTRRCLHAPRVKRAAREVAYRLLTEQLASDRHLLDRLLRLIEGA